MSNEITITDTMKAEANALQKSILDYIKTKLPNWFEREYNSITYYGLALSISHTFSQEKYLKLEGGEYNKLTGGRYKKCDHRKKCDCTPVPLFSLCLSGNGKVIYESSGKMALSEIDLDHQFEAVKTKINSYLDKLQKYDITEEVKQRQAIEKQQEGVFLADELKKILLAKLFESIKGLTYKDSELLSYEDMFFLAVYYDNIPPFICPNHKKPCECKVVPNFNVSLARDDGVIIFTEYDIKGYKFEFENFSSRSFHIRNIKTALNLAVENKYAENIKNKMISKLSKNDKIAIIEDAINNRQILKFIYYGGSQPGSIREIIPIKTDFNKLYAICPNTNMSKSFFFDKMDIVDTYKVSEFNNKQSSISSDVYPEKNNSQINKNNHNSNQEVIYHPSCFEKENNKINGSKKTLSVILIVILSFFGFIFGVVTLSIIFDSDETDIAGIIAGLIITFLFILFIYLFNKKAKEKNWL